MDNNKMASDTPEVVPQVRPFGRELSVRKYERTSRPHATRPGAYGRRPQHWRNQNCAGAPRLRQRSSRSRTRAVQNSAIAEELPRSSLLSEGPRSRPCGAQPVDLITEQRSERRGPPREQAPLVAGCEKRQR